MRALEFSYSDIMKMPTYERRLYIELYKSELEERKERLEEAQNNRSSGVKGTRTKTISGQALKSKMKNNEIPQ